MTFLGKDRFYWFISVYSDFCPVILWAQGDSLSELETTRFQMANDLLRTTGRDDAYLLVHLCSNRLPAWGVVSRSLADATQLRWKEVLHSHKSWLSLVWELIEKASVGSELHGPRLEQGQMMRHIAEWFTAFEAWYLTFTRSPSVNNLFDRGKVGVFSNTTDSLVIFLHTF